MASRGKHGGANRSEGMATRSAREYCGEEFELCDQPIIRCHRWKHPKGYHCGRLPDGRWLHWKIDPREGSGARIRTSGQSVNSRSLYR